MSDEDGLAQLVSSYGSDKSSSEDEQLEEIQCKTDQCDKIKTKELKDGDNFYDNITEGKNFFWDHFLGNQAEISNQAS